MEPYEFRQKMSLPYKAKVTHAKMRAQEFYDKLNGQVFCSVGGLDSITLLFFLRKCISADIPGVSVSTLEDKTVQEIHQSIPNMVLLTPTKSKVQVIREYGYPVVSKSIAEKIELIQNPNKDNETVRHAIETGETGEQGNFKYSRYMKLSDRWRKLFIDQKAPFKVSGKCCYYMKEKPCNQYSRQTKSFVYMGLMVGESGRRAMALMKNGCNYYGKTVTRSCPFAIFNKNDLLHLAVDLAVPVPAIYGEIVQRRDGTFTTTKAKRTGCTMCGFGVHMEKRPHRFDRLRETNYKEWHFWMYDMGWGKVLDYIGVPWEEYQPVMI